MKQEVGLESTILIVDDDIDLLDTVKDSVEIYFSSVLTADHPKIALDIIKNKQIDCVVTDYRMPDINGLELIDMVSKIHPTLPVILVTGNGDDPEVIDSIENGLFDYLDKPFKTSILVNRIRNALLLPKLESLILELARAEFPEIKVDKFMTLSPNERVKMIFRLDALIRTRLLAKSPTPGRKTA
jgi:DNA-binding NtrC family response regulator